LGKSADDIETLLCVSFRIVVAGSYMDQESAILVNDAYAILNNKTRCLLILQRSDQPFLSRFVVHRFHNNKPQTINLMDIIDEKGRDPHAKRVRRKRDDLNSDNEANDAL